MIDILKMNEYKFIVSLIKETDIFNNKLSYIDPYLIEENFTELKIKSSLFKHEKIYIKNNKDSVNLVAFRKPTFPCIENRIYIDFIVDIEDSELMNFLEKSIYKVKSIIKNKSAISIYIQKTSQTSSLMNTLKNLNFEQELVLKDELGKGKDVLLFTKLK